MITSIDLVVARRATGAFTEGIDRSGLAGPRRLHPTGLETTQSWNARQSRNQLNLSLIEDYYQRWLNDPTRSTARGVTFLKDMS